MRPSPAFIKQDFGGYSFDLDDHGGIGCLL